MKTTKLATLNISYVPLLLFAAVLAVTFSYKHVQTKPIPAFSDAPTEIVRNADKVSVKSLVVVDTSAKTSTNISIPAEAPVILPILPPKVLYREIPAYPVSVLERGIEGNVILSVFVDANGTPANIEIKSSSGCADLDVSAQKAVSLWKFEPAKRGASAIGCSFQVPVIFRIK